MDEVERRREIYVEKGERQRKERSRILRERERGKTLKLETRTDYENNIQLFFELKMVLENNYNWFTAATCYALPNICAIVAKKEIFQF